MVALFALRPAPGALADGTAPAGFATAVFNRMDLLRDAPQTGAPAGASFSCSTNG